MLDGMYKVIELIGTSTDSWEHAAKSVVEEANKHLRDLRVAEVAEQDLVIENGKVTAKSAGTLAGKTWNDFRKTECAANTPAATTTEPATKPAATTEPAKTTEPSKETAPAKPAATTSTTAVFPTAVSSKYASEKAGRARMHTCLDQYNANKAKDANGGLKWIEKGGGYYSECNKRLKG
jgi:flavin-binding protein dodecin